jgi:HEAT repeat protein
MYKIVLKLGFYTKSFSRKYFLLLISFLAVTPVHTEDRPQVNEKKFHAAPKTESHREVDRPLPNVHALVWQLFDNREDFRKDATLMPKVLCQRNGNVLPFLRVEPKNITPVDQNAPFLKADESKEKSDLGTSFQSKVKSALDGLSGMPDPILTIGMTSHGSFDTICRQFQKNLTMNDFVSTIFDAVEAFERKNHHPVHIVLVLDSCFSGSIRNALERKLAASDAEKALYENGTGKYRFKVDVYASAPGDQPSIGDLQKGGGLWTQLDSLNQLPNELQQNVHASFEEHQKAVCSIDGSNQHTVWSSYHPFPTANTPYGQKELVGLVKPGNLLLPQTIKSLAALGESGIAAIGEILSEPEVDPEIANHSLAALSRSKNSKAKEVLISAAGHSSALVRKAALSKMRWSDDGNYTPTFKAAAFDTSREIREIALEQLDSKLRDGRDIFTNKQLEQLTREAVQAQSSKELSSLLRQIDRLPPRLAGEAVQALTNGREPHDLARVLSERKALYPHLSPKAVKALVASMTDDWDNRQREQAVRDLLYDGAFDRHSATIAEMIQSKDEAERIGALDAARRVKSPAITQALRDLYLSSKNTELKKRALHSLALSLVPTDRDEFLIEELRKPENKDINRELWFQLDNAHAESMAKLQERIARETDPAFKATLMEILLLAIRNSKHESSAKVLEKQTPQLIEMFQDLYRNGETDKINELSLFGIGKLLGAAAKPAIALALKSEKKALAIAGIRASIATGDEGISNLVLPLLKAKDREVRSEAIEILARNSTPAMAERIAEVIRDNASDPDLLQKALWYLNGASLNKIPPRTDWLLALLQAKSKLPPETETDLSRNIDSEIYSLVRSLPPESTQVTLLAEMDRVKNVEQKLELIHQLSALPHLNFRAMLPKLLTNPSPEIRKAALVRIHFQVPDFLEAETKEHFFGEMADNMIQEKNTAVLKAYLATLTQFRQGVSMFANGRPFQEAESAILKWLESGEATRIPETERAAAQALLAIHPYLGGFRQGDSVVSKARNWADANEPSLQELGLLLMAGLGAPESLDRMKAELSAELKTPTKRSPETIAAIVAYFGQQRSLTLASYPTQALHHPKAEVRKAALEALSEIGEVNASIPSILEALRDDDAGVRAEALSTLARGSLDPAQVRKAYKLEFEEKLSNEEKSQLHMLLSRIP